MGLYTFPWETVLCFFDRTLTDTVWSAVKFTCQIRQVVCLRLAPHSHSFCPWIGTQYKQGASPGKEDFILYIGISICSASGHQTGPCLEREAIPSERGSPERVLSFPIGCAYFCHLPFDGTQQTSFSLDELEFSFITTCGGTHL